MAREILIQKTKTETRVPITVDGKLDDFHLETENQQSILGNIYKGKAMTLVETRRGVSSNACQSDPHSVLRQGWLSARPVSIPGKADDGYTPVLEEGEAACWLYDLGRDYACQGLG